MTQTTRIIGIGATAVVFGIIALALVQPRLITNLFDVGDYVPHAYCLRGDPGLTRLYGIADTLIALAYMAISGILTYLVYRASRNIPFHWVFLAFGAFIFTCGMTHFFDVLMLSTPIYWAGGYMKAITAVASVTTALILPPLVPRILHMAEAARKSEERRRRLIDTNNLLQSEVAERKRVERELRAALDREQELNTFRTNFIMRMSHEFRTPLSIALTASDLLRLYNARLNDAQRTERLEQIQTQIQAMVSMLDDILAINRIEAGREAFQPRPLNPVALVGGAIQNVTFSSGDTHPIFFTHEALDVTTPLDEKLFLQIVHNLLLNAVKYSPVGSPIRVDLTTTDETLTLRVADSGIGIPADEQARVFDLFYRASNVSNEPGTGLGLSIAQHGAEAHGGQIALESRLGLGTTFTVTLPRAAPSSPTP